MGSRDLAEYWKRLDSGRARQADPVKSFNRKHCILESAYNPYIVCTVYSGGRV